MLPDLLVSVSDDDAVNVMLDVKANVPVPPGIVCPFTVPKLVMLFDWASNVPPSCGVVSSTTLFKLPAAISENLASLVPPAVEPSCTLNVFKSVSTVTSLTAPVKEP